MELINKQTNKAKRFYDYSASFVICVCITIAILFSSCGAGRHSALSFSKRKYTNGNFSNPVVKVKTPVHVNTAYGKEVKVSVAKSPLTTTNFSTAAAATPHKRQPQISNHFTSWMSLVGNHSPLNKILHNTLMPENPGHAGGIPGRDKDNTNANTTNYGGTGLALTLFSIGAFLFGALFIGRGSSFFSGGNGNDTESAFGVILLIASPILFIIGLVLNIMGTNKRDRNKGDAIAGLVIDIILFFFILGLAL